VYKILNTFAFFGTIIWLLIDQSPEPVIVLLMTVAGFFRDDIHGIVGKNIFKLTPKSKLIRNFDLAKYSFINNEFINPRIIEDLTGWLSDSGNQVVAINITDSNESNRYFGEITIDNSIGKYPLVRSSFEESTFSYQYLGTSFSGVHLLQTWSNTGGSGVFCEIVLVILSMDEVFDNEEKINRFVIKLIGTIPLGDRYIGNISYTFGILTIPACKGMATLRDKMSKILVI
jgi:hypothetical protein